MPDSRLLLAAFLSALALTASAAQDENTLIVNAAGFAHARGHAIAKLFEPGDNVLEHGRRQLIAGIRDGKASFEFKGLPAGAYAVVVFHDENDNGEIDHNLLRLPSEALGFSNGFRPGLLSGLPSFDKLRFEHAVESQHIEVIVK
ncbi:MAG: DUF2141 domain-containing protein [Proteobacteria bacterium]|nr:DUF2141 domain-containing protein [Pseudomonadota bacterium]